MRISMKRHDSPAPCDTFVHGEVEDYSIQLVPQDAGSSQSYALPQAFQFQVYPNPAHQEVTAVFEQHISSGQLRVINLMGQVLYTKTITTECGSLLLEVSGFTPGVYFMELSVPNEQPITRKWIKE